MKPIAPLLLLCAACLLTAPAGAAPRAGQTAEDTPEIQGTRLQLNGAGTRWRGPFKVYDARLYLARKAGSPDEVLAAPGAKRLAMTMLREVDATELGRLFIRSMEDNLSDRAALSRLVPGLMRMSQIFSEHKRLRPGDAITIDWVPGTGTVISVKGVTQGEPFREPEFHAALMRIWLGPVPADWRLKEHLLGKEA